MLDIHWEDEVSHAFVNPRLSEGARESVKPVLPGHIFLTTSGTNRLKTVALSKKAFLASGAAVNEHIQATLKDIWINPLPYFHVGGLSIYARAYLSKSYVYRFDHKWNPQKWTDFVNEKRGSLTSLVPTQLWDLCEAGITPPKSLRALFIGGSALSSSLYNRAKEKGWPILPAFGMTEMCSQVATANFDSPDLHLLSHVEAKISPNGRLVLKSDALLTGYYTPDFHDPKINGWFETEDLADLKGSLLLPKGRGSDVFKIKGELVNLFELEALLDELKARLNFHGESAIIPKEDERQGYKLTLYHTDPNIHPLIEAFNQAVIPEARLFDTVRTDTLPRNSMGKLLRR